MELTPNIELHDLTIYLKKQKTLILADLHLGYETNLRANGYLVPWFQYEEIQKRLTPILEKLKPHKIIINGDMKHEFGKIPQREWDEVKGMISFLKERCSELVLIKGNHDSILGPIAKHKEVKLIEEAILVGDTFITHGHKLFKIPTKAKTILIAHEHPAITITDNISSETVKCYLKGTYKEKTLIVQPSICLAAEGSDVLTSKKLSPFLTSIDDFEVFVVADKILPFGKVINLIS